VALPSKGRRQREDLGKGRIAICYDDDGSSQVVVDLCYMRIRPATTLRKVRGPEVSPKSFRACISQACTS
jgi:hypothetical protein